MSNKESSDHIITHFVLILNLLLSKTTKVTEATLILDKPSRTNKYYIIHRMDRVKLFD